MQGIWQDVRYGIRLLKREPGFAAVAMLTIALGVGATTTLFSVANGVLLKPLPWPGADRLVRLTETRQGHVARIKGTISNATFLAWRNAPATLDALAAYGPSTVTASIGDGEPVRLPIGRVTPSLFDVLRVRPLFGRVLQAEDAVMGGTGQPPPATSVVLSYGLWQEWFGGREDAIGRSMTIDAAAVKIVGVMPKAFSFPDADARAWTPMSVGAVVVPGGGLRISIFSALGRMKPGVTPAQVAADGSARARGGEDPGLAAMAMYGSTAPADISAVPAAEAMTAEVRPAILLLLASVALLLATAIANVGSLQLARATVRRREIAIRAAIGAGTARLTRQLIVESALIGIAGGVAGLAVTVALHRALPSLLPADFPRVRDIAIDVRVLAFGLGASLVTSVVCGLLPAVHARRIDLVESLADGSAGATGGVWRSRAGRWRAVIMAGQVAAACVLLVGAALLARSFNALLHADRGYDPANVLTARVDLPPAYTAPRWVAFADALTVRLMSAPGVTHAAAGNALPFLTIGGAFAFEMPSPRDPAIKIKVQTTTRIVGPEYFPAMRLRMVDGRPLTDADSATTRPVVVVNRTFARQYLGRTPIGSRVPIRFGEGRPDGEVVGVVEDMRQADVTDPQTPEVFASYRQLPLRVANAPMTLVARTAGDPSALVPFLRAAVRELDRGVAIDSIMTLDDRLQTSLARPRTYAVLLGGFAICALAIAGVGLFGVLSYGVAQRSREIGVRSALGAQPRDIVALVLRQGMVMAGAGLAAGLAAAGAAAKVLSAFLYGVSTHDVWSFVAVPIALASVAAVACVVPARRAARVDPLIVLRSG